MSTITRISWTVADGNCWTEDEGYDEDASLNLLVRLTEEALRAAYPEAEVTVRRENVGGGVRALEAYSDEPDGYVDDDAREAIIDTANAVWYTDAWYVAKAA